MSCNFLFVLTSVCLIITLVQSINFQSQTEPEKLTDIRNYLKKINKPAVKTIKSPDGDMIDCVLFHRQPAFDHPLLQGHKPTMDPPALPKGSNNNHSTVEENFQVWRMSGESCPKNTIPIRRTTEEDVLRATSVQTFGRKRINTAMKNAIVSHEHAIAYTTGDKFYGAEGYINVWNPKVENEGEFSIAQIWVITGNIEAGTLNSVEVGSIVNYGDNHPKLFVFWTSDGYRKTGCYNLECPGFVQVSKRTVVGSAINPISTYNGEQFHIRVTVWKAPEDGNWWVAIQGEAVGYWPSSLFPLLREKADEVQFGGEIVNSGSGGHHTSTQMGSGHFPNEGFKKSAFIKNLRIADSNNILQPNYKFDTFIKNPKCYSAEIGASKDKDWGTYVYYGGAGRDAPGCT